MKNIKPIILVSIILLIGGIAMLSIISNKDNVTEKDENPRKRQEYRMKRKGGSIPFEKIAFAKGYTERFLLPGVSNVRDGDIGGWESLGPRNIGGRIRGLAIHPTNPQIIFAGTASGGLWKTLNGGNSWSVQTPSLQSYPVSDVIFHPTDPSIILASTGEYIGSRLPGVGVLRSTDGGLSFNVMNQPASGNFTFLSRIRVHPNLANVVYTCGSKRDVYNNNDVGVVYKSNNYGVTWTEIWQDNNSNNIYDIEFGLRSGGQWTIILGTNSGVAISSAINIDDFLYVPVPGNVSYNIMRCEIEICDSNQDSMLIMIYEENGNGSGFTRLIEGDISNNPNFDNLTQWSEYLGNQGDYNNTLWTNPYDCNQIIIGGVETYRYDKSVDTVGQISDGDHDIGANAWESNNNSIHVDQHVILEHPDFDNVNNKIVYIGNDGGVYRSTNISAATIGTTWQSFNNNFEVTQFYGGDISLDGNVVVGGSQDNHYVFNNNAGNSNKIWQTYSRGDGGYCAINKNNPSIFYTTTQRGNLYKTTDGGQSFCHILSISNSSQFSCCTGCNNFTKASLSPVFIAPFKMHKTQNNKLYIAGQDLLYSDDGGISWSLKEDANINSRITAMDISTSNPDLVWIGRRNGTITYTNTLSTTNNWVIGDVNNEIADQWVTDISIHPANDSLIAIAIAGYRQDNVFISEDGGKNWMNRSLPFDMQVNSLTWMPENQNLLYIGTDIGIYASEDKGENWSLMPYLGQNEGPLYVEISQLFWQGNGSSDFPYFLLAATYGRGMWRTTSSIRGKLYVDKNCNPCGNGTFDKPYQYFSEAVATAISGSTIVFLSSGIHDDIVQAQIIEKQLKIVSQNSLIME